MYRKKKLVKGYDKRCGRNFYGWESELVYYVTTPCRPQYNRPRVQMKIMHTREMNRLVLVSADFSEKNIFYLRAPRFIRLNSKMLLKTKQCFLFFGSNIVLPNICSCQMPSQQCRGKWQGGNCGKKYHKHREVWVESIRIPWDQSRRLKIVINTWSTTATQSSFTYKTKNTEKSPTVGFMNS